MSPLRATIEVTLMILAWIIMTLLIFLFANKFTNAKESLSGIFTLNLADETATYTEHNDFSEEYGVRMTASVEKSPCLKCLDNLYITDCQSIGLCLDVAVY